MPRVNELPAYLLCIDASVRPCTGMLGRTVERCQCNCVPNMIRQFLNEIVGRVRQCTWRTGSPADTDAWHETAALKASCITPHSSDFTQLCRTPGATVRTLELRSLMPISLWWTFFFCVCSVSWKTPSHVPRTQLSHF